MHLWMQMVATKCTSNKQKHHTGKGITSYGFLKPPQRRGSDKTARPTPDCDNTADQLHTNLHQASGIKHTIYFEEHAGATLERSPSKSAECREPCRPNTAVCSSGLLQKNTFSTFTTFWKVYNMCKSSAYNQGCINSSVRCRC